MVDIVELPTVPFAQCEFDPIRPSSTERMEGRRVESQSTGTPYWVAKYKTDFLTREKAGLMSAFQMLCGDNGGVFRAFDVDRQRPLKYLGGFPSGFNGNATVRGFNNSRSVEVGSLPSGLQFVVGDYLEIRKTALVRSLHRITAAATASASGVATIKFDYPIDLQEMTFAYWRSYKTLAGAQRALRKRGHKSLKSFFAEHLETVPPASAQVGDIVVILIDNGEHVGVCLGASGRFVTKTADGPSYHRVGECLAAFRT